MSATLPSELFAGLFDDASALVGATLEETLEGRKRRIGTSQANYVGSLLLPPRMIKAALATKGSLRITIVSGRDDDLEKSLAIAEQVSSHRRHELVGLHVPYSPTWREALNLLVPVVVRLPAGGARFDALDEFSGSGPMIRAGIRSGGEHAAASAELAAFVHACAARSVAFHLAGGMGGAITGEPGRHGNGVLNMLLATKLALRHRSEQDIGAALRQDDQDLVIAHIRALTEDKALEIRRLFRSVSYSDVRTAIADLGTHGLADKYTDD